MSLSGPGKADFSHNDHGKSNENPEVRPSSSVSGGRRRSVTSISDSGKRYMPSAPDVNLVHKNKPSLLDRTIEPRNNTLPEVAKPDDEDVGNVQFEIETPEDAEFDEKALQEKMEKTVAKKSFGSKLWGIIKSPTFLGGLGLVVTGFVMVAACTVLLALPGGVFAAAALFSVGLTLSSLGTSLLFCAFFVDNDDSQNYPPVNPRNENEESSSNNHEDSSHTPSEDPTGKKELPPGSFRADPVSSEDEEGGQFAAEPDSGKNDELQGEFKVEPELTHWPLHEMTKDQRDIVFADVVESMMKGFPKDSKVGLLKREEFTEELKDIGQRMLDERMLSSDSTIGLERDPTKYISSNLGKRIEENAKNMCNEQDGGLDLTRRKSFSASDVSKLEIEVNQEVENGEEVASNAMKSLNTSPFGMKSQTKRQLGGEESDDSAGLNGGGNGSENGGGQDQRQQNPSHHNILIENVVKLHKEVTETQELLKKTEQAGNMVSEEITRLKKEVE